MGLSRWSGVAGFMFLGSVLLLNGMRAATGRPLGDAAMTDIVAYFVEHGSIPRLASYMAPIPMLSFPVFAAGVLALTRDGQGRLNTWGVVELAGAVMNVSVFAGVLATDAILGSRASTLAENPQYAQMLWDLNVVLFPLAVGCAALALGGLGLAVLTSGVGPRLGKVALAGAAFLLAGAIQSQPALAGSSTPAVAVPGVLIWLSFVVVVSVKMIRQTGSPDN